MRTKFKRLGVVIVGAVVMALMTAVAVTWLFDANAYKSQIEALVEKETGYALSIDGDVSLSFLPGPGVRVGATVLRHPADFAGAALAEFDALALRLKLAPLLTGRIEPDTLRIAGLRVRLLRTASGRTNFDRLLAPDNAPGGPRPALLALGGLTLEDASLSYEDQEIDERLQLTDLQLSAGALDPGATVPVAARFRFSGSMINAEGVAEMEAALSLEPSRRRYGADGLTLAVALQGNRLPGGRLDLKLSAGARYDAATRFLAVTDLKLVTGDAGADKAPITLVVPAATLDLAAHTASLENVFLSATGVDIRGEFTAGALASQPTVSGKLRLASFRPRELLTRFGQALPGPIEDKLPQAVHFEASLAADGEHVTLDPVQLVLDDVHVRGRIDAGLAADLPVKLALEIDSPPLPSGNRLRLTLRGIGRRGDGASTYAANNLVLTLGPLTARGTINVDTSAGDPSYTGSFEVPAFNARALLKHLEQPVPVTGDPRALTRVGAKATVSGARSRLVLDPLTIDMDDTRVEGNLSVSDAFSAKRAINFVLRANALDAGRYLPFRISSSEQETPALTPLAALQAADLNGRIRLGALTISEVVIKEIELVTRSKDGQLELRSGSVPRMSRLSEGVADSSPPTASAP